MFRLLRGMPVSRRLCCNQALPAPPPAAPALPAYRPLSHRIRGLWERRSSSWRGGSGRTCSLHCGRCSCCATARRQRRGRLRPQPSSPPWAPWRRPPSRVRLPPSFSLPCLSPLLPRTSGFACRIAAASRRKRRVARGTCGYAAVPSPRTPVAGSARQVCLSCGSLRRLATAVFCSLLGNMGRDNFVDDQRASPVNAGLGSAGGAAAATLTAVQALCSGPTGTTAEAAAAVKAMCGAHLLVHA